ncbi:MAG: arginase family protein [Carboxylicivirga sp.]|nr:arginase family protein [Carboxylicivirga sp.]
MTEDLTHYFKESTFRTIPAFAGEFDDRLESQIISFHKQERINWDKVDVAIIGVADGRWSSKKGVDKTPDLLRPYLYGLRTVSKPLNIVDMGNVLGATVDDRYTALEEVVYQLIQEEVLPLVIGGSQDYTLPLCGALKKKIDQFRLAVVDSRIDWQSPDRDFSSEAFLGYLCDDDRRTPRDLSVIGVQKYLYSNWQEKKLLNRYFDFLRMGQIRQEGHRVAEPWLRDADAVSFDMTVVRQCDQPAHELPMPNGLTGEELCQFGWYAGLSDKLKVIGLFELDTLLDINNQGVGLGAQLVWHILEGIALRYKDYPVKALEGYRQFVVHLEDYEFDITFYHNQENDRWWVEIPGKDKQTEVMACGRADFETASKNEIPERWFRFIRKNKL